MISQNSYSAAAPLVDKLTVNRKVARALPGSTLEQLTALKTPIGLLEAQDPSGAITDRCPCDTEEHKATMSYLVDLCANTVQNTLFNAKNVVVPMIQQLVDGYERYVSATVNGSSNCVVVKPVFYGDIWNNPVVTSLAERFDGVAIRKVSLTMKFPVKVADEINALVKTGNARFDKELEDFLTGLQQQYGFDVLTDTYQAIFSFENSKGLSTLDDIINPFTGNRNTALLTFLLANKLMVEVPEGMESSLMEYKAYVSGILEQSGRAVARIQTLIEEEVKNKSLIISYPTQPFGNPYTESVIEVNGKVYNQWLNEGGQPEILFGAYASNKERGYQALLDDKDGLLNTWEREKRLIDSKVRLEMKAIKSSALRKSFFDFIKDLTDDQKRLTNVDMVTMADHLIDNMDLVAFDYIYKYARKLICRGVFPGTDFEDLLRSIDEISNANKGIDEREAALLATVEYVAGWLASQIKCESF